MRKLDAALLAAALAGCAGTPIAQGGPAEIVYARDDMIRIRWNPQRTDERAMRSKAIAFCGGRRVDEVDASSQPEASGPLLAKTWRCEMFPGTGGGM